MERREVQIQHKPELVAEVLAGVRFEDGQRVENEEKATDEEVAA